MKKLFFFFLFFVPMLGFCQKGSIIIHTVHFVAEDVKPVDLDTSITNKLEPFIDEYDAVIYIYRLRSVVGCAVPWHVRSEYLDDHLWQRQYVVLHIDTRKKSHWISHKYFSVNYTGFKPHHYYAYRLKGYTFKSEYLDQNLFRELETCKKTKKAQKDLVNK